MAPSTALTTNADETTSSQISASSSACSRLPHEIVVKILQHLLIFEDQPLELRSNAVWYRRDNLRADETYPYQNYYGQCKIPESGIDSVLHGNRRFYFAGVETFYGGNEMFLVGPRGLRTFLHTIGRDRRRCIRKLRIGDEYEWNGRTWAIGQTKLADAYRLQPDPLAGLEDLERLLVGVWLNGSPESSERVAQIKEVVHTAWPSAEGKTSIVNRAEKNPWPRGESNVM